MEAKQEKAEQAKLQYLSKLDGQWKDVLTSDRVDELKKFKYQFRELPKGAA